jgi:hypothetical protein
MQRRVVSIKHAHGYEECANAEEAATLEAQWREEGRNIFAMYPAKMAALMALAPVLMARMITMHQAATKPGGSWPAKPPEVEGWTHPARPLRAWLLLPPSSPLPLASSSAHSAPHPTPCATTPIPTPHPHPSPQSPTPPLSPSPSPPPPLSRLPLGGGLDGGAVDRHGEH